LVFSWNQFTLDEFAGQNAAAEMRLLFINFLDFGRRLLL